MCRFHHPYAGLMALGMLALTGCQDGAMQRGSDARTTFIDSVLSTLTIEDKAGEMTQLTLDMVCVGKPYKLEEPHRIDPEKLEHVLVDLKVGSILNCGGHAYYPETWHELIGSIQ